MKDYVVFYVFTDYLCDYRRWLYRLDHKKYFPVHVDEKFSLGRVISIIQGHLNASKYLNDPNTEMIVIGRENIAELTRDIATHYDCKFYITDDPEKVHLDLYGTKYPSEEEGLSHANKSD